MLPHVMEFNALACPRKMIEVGLALGEPPASLGVGTGAVTDYEGALLVAGAVRRLERDIGIPERLSDLGVDKASFPDMAADAMKSANIAINPRKTTINEWRSGCSSGPTEPGVRGACVCGLGGGRASVRGARFRCAGAARWGPPPSPRTHLARPRRPVPPPGRRPARRAGLHARGAPSAARPRQTAGSGRPRAGTPCRRRRAIRRPGRGSRQCTPPRKSALLGRRTPGCAAQLD